MSVVDRLRTEPWPPGRHAYRPCPRCSEPWRPWAGSVLPCHAKCLLTPDEQEALLDEEASVTEQAARLGVTVGIVRASIAAAQKRRKTRAA